MSNFLLGGRLGDLIHALYVVKNTPGKHNLFITDRRDLHSDGFLLSLDETYDELFPIITTQDWCNSFNMFIGLYQGCANLINLSMWRRYAYSASWTQLLSNTFNVLATGGAWLELPKLESWSEIIVFHSSIYEARRGPGFEIPYSKYGDERAVFVGTTEEFKSLGYPMSFYQPKSLQEHFQIIASCKFFVGNQSAPLAMAHALDVPRLAVLNKTDEIHYIGEEKFYPNFCWISEGKCCYEGLNY